MTKWQVLDLISHEGYVSAERGSLVVGEVRVPATDLGVVLLGQKASWGYGLVHKATQYDFAVLICDWRQVPIAYLAEWSDNTRVVARHRAQAEMTEPRKKNAWKRIVAAKVLSQALCLEQHQKPETRLLRNLAKQVRSGDPENLEGHAAAVYWRALFGTDFRRNHDAPDLINGALNYGYTLLRGVVIRELVGSGLCPSLALFHRSRDNTFALADDLIEPFRPLIDHQVASVCDRYETLDRSMKADLAAVLGAPYGIEGQNVNTSVREACQSYARYVEGDLASFKPPLWSR